MSFESEFTNWFADQLDVDVPDSVAELVDILGGTHAAVDALGDNPRTGKPYTQRAVQRWIAYDRGSGSQARQISPDALKKLQDAAKIKLDADARDQLVDELLDDGIDLDIEGEMGVSDDISERAISVGIPPDNPQFQRGMEAIRAGDFANGALDVEEAFWREYGVPEAVWVSVDEFNVG